MGLGSVKENQGLYLSVAGGFIWDRKAEKTHPEYAVQEFDRVDGTKGERSGARYADLTGNVTGVEFRTHDQYGESINVSIKSGEETFIMSISTNNRYSQDMMKALLKADLNEDIYIKPYDFTDPKTNKRVQGISFRQDGEKIDLKVDTPDEFTKEKDWFKNANKKQIKRFFEDLSDWFVGEVEEKVVPMLSDKNEVDEQQEEEKNEPEQKPKEKVQEKVEEAEKPKSNMTPLKMKKFLKEYISENYEGKELPKLSKDEVIQWYDLAFAMEELPFEEDSNDEDSDVDVDDIQAQLDALAG